jgi:hypothetical protein
MTKGKKPENFHDVISEHPPNLFIISSYLFCVCFLINVVLFIAHIYLNVFSDTTALSCWLSRFFVCDHFADFSCQNISVCHLPAILTSTFFYIFREGKREMIGFMMRAIACSLIFLDEVLSR